MANSKELKKFQKLMEQQNKKEQEAARLREEAESLSDSLNNELAQALLEKLGTQDYTVAFDYIETLEPLAGLNVTAESDDEE